jgi:hypothetical protein
MEGAATFGVTDFAWASSYVLSVALGVVLVDPREDAIFHPSLTGTCLIMMLLRRLACRASD